MKYGALVAAAAYYENKLFFVTRGIKGNCLFEYDASSTCVTELYVFPEFADFEGTPFSAIIYSEGYIYLITSNIDCIIALNYFTREVSMVEMPFDKNGMIITAKKEGNNIYLLDAKKPSVYIYDVVNRSFKEENNWVKDIKPYIFDNNDVFFRKQMVMQDGFLIIPFCNANAVLKLSTEKPAYEVVSFSKDKNGYAGIVYDNGEYWLFPRRNNMYILCCDEHLVARRKIEIKDAGECFRCFGAAVEEKSFALFCVGAEKAQIEDKEHSYVIKNNMELLFQGIKTIYTDVYEGYLFIKGKNEKEHSMSMYIDVSAKDMDRTFNGEALIENKRIDLKFLLQYVANQ